LAPQAEMDLKRLSEVSKHKTLGADIFLLKKELDKKQVILVITIRHTHTPSSLKQYHHEEKVRKYIPVLILSSEIDANCEIFTAESHTGDFT
jgi:hypothetical protein